MPRGFVLFGCLLAGASPAVAQQSAAPKSAPSVEAYLCTFAGKCDAASGPVATRDAPETKGFRLARPNAAPKEESSAIVPRRSARREAARAGYVAPADAARRSTAARSYAAGRAVAQGAGVAASARPRADLMIGFELNSAQLSADGRSAAQVFARSLLMPELQGKRFLIEGHTDLRGGRALNAGLSARRAQAVADYLRSLGVSGDRLQTRGYGSSQPLPGHRVTDPANRRVEAVLLS